MEENDSTLMYEESANREWQRYQLDHVVAPNYIVPYSGLEVSATLFDQYDVYGDLSVVNVWLPFHSTPVWPFDWDYDRDSPDCLLFYYCGGGNGCTKPVAHKHRLAYRLVLQMTVGTFVSTGRSYLGWVPRLLCADCAPLDGDTSAFPIVLNARQCISGILDTVLNSFNDKVSRRKCYICEVRLKNRATEGTIPFCGSKECMIGLKMIGRERVVKTMYEPPAYQRLLNTVHHLKNCRLDVVSCMRWNICHNIKGNCLKCGNSTLECGTCHRVVYCSKKCKDESAELHARHCNGYLELWNMEKLKIWNPDFISELMTLVRLNREREGVLSTMSMNKPQKLYELFCKCETPNGSKEPFEKAVRCISKKRNGRAYYTCALGQTPNGCGFFRWEKDIAAEYEEDSFCVADGEGEDPHSGYINDEEEASYSGYSEE